MSRDEQKYRRREEILRTAEELFITRGLASTSMPDIAQRADLNVRTIYRYYKTKEELAFEIEIKIFENMIEKLQSAAQVISGKNGYVKTGELLSLIENYYRLSKDEIRFTGEFDHYFTGAYPYNSLSRRFVKMLRSINNPLRSFLDEGREDGSIRGDLDTELTVATIENTMLALAQRVVTRAEHLELEQGVSPAAMLPCLVQLIMSGIKSRCSDTITADGR